MKFSKGVNLDIIKNNSVIEGNNVGKCLICKSSTRFIEVCSESYFCSEECLDKFYAYYNKLVSGFES